MAAEEVETTMVEFGDRMIEVRRPSDGALLVMSRVARSLPGGVVDLSKITEEQKRKLMRDVGAAGAILDAMVVQEPDRNYLDDGMIDGTFEPADVFAIVSTAIGQLRGEQAPTTGPQPAVRRIGKGR